MFEFAHEVAVKICGVTNQEDALAAALGGADMIGLNFAPRSPRQISPIQAAEIIAAVRVAFPRVKFVGVFVDEENARVRQLAHELELDAVQLHGKETPADVSALRECKVIKAIRISPTFSPQSATEYECEAVLLDSWNAGVAGGTGETFPWGLAAATRPHVRSLILAGGLNSANVGRAIREVHPFAVDVCSGVELSPGKKNLDAIGRFMTAVRGWKEAPVPK